MPGGYGHQALNEEVAIALVQAGADPNYRVPVSSTYVFQQTDGGTALHLAAAAHSSKMVNYLLQHGANPNARDAAGATPLHRAIYDSDPDVIRALIAAGATANRWDNQGRTPLEHLNATYSQYQTPEKMELLGNAP